MNTQPQLDCQTRIATPENATFEYAVAGPFQRFPAFLFDFILRWFVFLIFVFVISFFGIFSALASEAIGFLLLVTGFIVNWFYGIFFEARFNGRTPGKRIFKLRVISKDGRPINAEQAALRNLLRVSDLSVLLPLAIFAEEGSGQYVIPTFSLGLIVMTLTNRFERIGDLAAGTIVISEYQKVSPWNLKPDDVRAYGLAELIPSNFVFTNTLAQAIALYMENRLRLSPNRRAEIAKHLAVPLLKRFNLLPNTSYDLLMCAMYVKMFLTQDQQSEGAEQMRQSTKISVPSPMAPRTNFGFRSVNAPSLDESDN